MQQIIWCYTNVKQAQHRLQQTDLYNEARMDLLQCLYQKNTSSQASWANYKLLVKNEAWLFNSYSYKQAPL